jgi:hypothetical protein
VVGDLEAGQRGRIPWAAGPSIGGWSAGRDSLPRREPDAACLRKRPFHGTLGRARSEDSDARRRVGRCGAARACEGRAGPRSRNRTAARRLVCGSAGGKRSRPGRGSSAWAGGRGLPDLCKSTEAGHGHEDRDPGGGLADLKPAPVPPVPLHRLARLAENLRIHRCSRRADLAKMPPRGVEASAMPLRALGDLLQDRRGGPLRLFRRPRLDLRRVRIEDRGARHGPLSGRLPHRPGLGHGPGGTEQRLGNRPIAETFDLVQATNLGPQGSFQGCLRTSGLDCPNAGKISPNEATPPRLVAARAIAEDIAEDVGKILVAA